MNDNECDVYCMPYQEWEMSNECVKVNAKDNENENVVNNVRRHPFLASRNMMMS